VASEAAIAGEVLDAIGLTDDLPEMLGRDEVGRSFEPVQIDPRGDLMQQLALLLRREPVGGAETQIRENGCQIQQRAIDQYNRALAGARCSPWSLIQSLLAESRAGKSRLESRAQQVEQAYIRTQERLHRWQDHMGQRAGSLGGDLLRWLFGSGRQLSLPQAVALWNEREYQAFDRAALAEALRLYSWFIDMLTDRLTRLRDLLEEARQLHTTIAQQYRQMLHTTAFAPWTVAIAVPIVADVLIEQADPERMLAEVLRKEADAPGGAGRLAESVEATARHEAERLLTPLGITDLIELEARAAIPTADVDPVLLVGQELLATLERPTWQITRGARPRIEALQVVPGDVPVYSMDDMTTASYGADLDRLGFVQVQLGVAKDELLILREGAESFQAALQQRNLYVLEELAQAWEAEHAIVGLTVPATEPATLPPA
jgi:hypothetical protein